MRASAALAVSTFALACATSASFVVTSAASVGISKRTSRSPALTRSPSLRGSSAMRADSGAVTVQSNPDSAATTPVALTVVSNVGTSVAGFTDTGTSSSVATLSTGL